MVACFLCHPSPSHVCISPPIYATPSKPFVSTFLHLRVSTSRLSSMSPLTRPLLLCLPTSDHISNQRLWPLLSVHKHTWFWNLTSGLIVSPFLVCPLAIQRSKLSAIIRMRRWRYELSLPPIAQTVTRKEKEMPGWKCPWHDNQEGNHIKGWDSLSLFIYLHGPVDSVLNRFNSPRPVRPSTSPWSIVRVKISWWWQLRLTSMFKS